jgi:hypothetical protein
MRALAEPCAIENTTQIGGDSMLKLMYEDCAPYIGHEHNIMAVHEPILNALKIFSATEQIGA